MYRDDPLDDEMELRALIGDEAVDRLGDQAGGGLSPSVEAALDALRVLQGWVDDDAAGRWFSQPQRRLGDETPIDALAAGEHDDVLDAARAWAAANG